MEFKQTGFFFPGNDQLINSYTEMGPISNCGTSELLGDTTLRLDCLGYERSSTAEISQSNFDVQSVQAITPQISQRIHDAHPTQVPDDGCKLVLGLGPTLSAYSYNSYSVGATENREAPPDIIGQQFSLDNDSVMLKLGLPRASEDLLSLHQISTSSQSEPNSFDFPNQHPSSENRVTVPLVDEGSTSAKRASGGFMPSLLLAPRLEFSSKGTAIASPNSHHIHLHSSPEPSPTTDGSACTIISYSTTPGPGSEYRGHHPRKCRFNGCTKGARGASGLCIAHGGGQRCQKPGCNRGAESRTAYCKAHGGGLRCQQLGCTKSAEGKTEYCIAHGGGRRCGDPGCAKAARGKSGLCIKHGGGKRCSVEECTRSAEGQAGLCISHGGGRRCQSSGCNKGAQGSTMYCKAHGGGKRCIFAGCTKGAEGSTPLCKGHGGGKRCLYDGGGICPKSVHGGTDYCVAHGGGKRCAVPGCTKSARGRTDCCVKHGGGKRCRFENCGKSAQGSTDFCKAHGGGKRCSWGHGTCEKFARGKSGLCAAHANMSQENERIGKGGMIRPGLFSGLVSLSTVGTSVDNDYSSGASAVSDSAKSDNSGSKQLIPPQVLVPLSMKSSSSSVGEDSRGRGNQGITYVVPEGRVHGGGLMSLFGGDLKNAIGGV